MLTTLARLFIDLLKIGANSVDAKRLKDYKAPKSASNATFNDFAAVLFEVLKSRDYSRYLHNTYILHGDKLQTATIIIQIEILCLVLSF